MKKLNFSISNILNNNNNDDDEDEDVNVDDDKDDYAKGSDVEQDNSEDEV